MTSELTPRRGNLVGVLSAVALVGVCVAACVGDTASPNGGGPGADGGGPGSGADGSVIQGGGQDGGNVIITDAGGADATDANTPDVGVDAGPQCNEPITPPTYTCGPVNTACYDDSTSAHSCVASSMACRESGYVTAIEFSCFSQMDCKNGEYCCTSFLQINTTACPGTIKYGGSGGGACGNTVRAAGSCPIGERILCSSKAGCPGGKTCWPVTAQDPPSLVDKSFGICL